MKLTLNWLKQYVDFDGAPEQLAQRLTMLGLEVEGIHKIGGEFEGVVVAEVLTREKHPNADKLSLCGIRDGAGQRQIVCGAQNFKPGDKVPLILPGASLPAKPGEKPLTIKVGKIRGVQSHGMLCSPDELGLPPGPEEGLAILRHDAKVGQPFSEYLGRDGGDAVYDLETTPNRPDWNSVIGIAREISALTGNPLRIPQIQLPEPGDAPGAADLVSVRIEAPDLCPRYTARIIRGVKIGPSPDWLRGALEKVGIRSISNVVDVTNYVMLETGQPLHAFDYHLLSAGTEPQSPPTVVVRRAGDGEKFVTLDGKEHRLSSDTLLIADAGKGIALAGVMGGINTEINEHTVDVLIESAYFKPQNIRATSRKLDLRTDSSYRFERGADINICDWASRRAARLILDTAGGQLARGVVDVYPNPVEPGQITLRHAKATQLLGIEIPPAENVGYLARLGLEPVNQTAPGTCAFRVPTFRVDLKREADLIEEIVRLYGVDRIPASPPRGAIGGNAYDAICDQIAEARRILAGLGLNEAQGQTLISEDAAKQVSAQTPVSLANPLSSDMNVLRPSLLPGLLDALRHNLSHRNNDVALFEIGRVFTGTNGGTREDQRLALALTGNRNPAFWSGGDRDTKCDVYDLKGILEEFFEAFGLRGMTWNRRADGGAIYLESAAIQLGKATLGELGQLAPLLAKRYDLRDPVLLAELNLDTLLARRNPAKSFKPLAAFPSIRRDVAMILPEATTHEAVLSAIKQAKPQFLESVELFDVFRGKSVAEGQKSVAYAFTYRHSERTLTDAEVNAAHEKVVQKLKQDLRAAVRE